MNTVYILSSDDGKLFYVGSTSNLNKRVKRHQAELKANKHHNSLMQEAFNIGVMFEVNYVIRTDTREEAYQIENGLIKSFNGDVGLLNIGLNSRGGDNLTRNPRREEIIKTIADSVRERMSQLTDEERKCIYGRSGEQNGMYGRHHTEETKEYLRSLRIGKSPGNKGKPLNPEQYAKFMEHIRNRDITGKNNPFYGKTHTKESRDKIRSSASGRVSSRRKSLSIDGVLYPSLSHAAKELDIPLVTIRHRCLSENPKFTNWILL